MITYTDNSILTINNNIMCIILYDIIYYKIDLPQYTTTN